MHAALAHLPRLLLAFAAALALVTLLSAPDQSQQPRPAAPAPTAAVPDPPIRSAPPAAEALPTARSFARAYATFLSDPGIARARRAMRGNATPQLMRALTSSGARPLPDRAPIVLERITQAHAPRDSSSAVFTATYRHRSVPITVQIEVARRSDATLVVDVGERIASSTTRGAT